MRARFAVLLALVVAGLLMVPGGSSHAANLEKYITIGTAGVSGVYYPAGGAICRLVMRGRQDHGIRCFVEPTDGSVYNLEALRAGDLDMAIVQSDWQFHAANGSSLFKEQGPFAGLRSVFSLYAEPFTVAVRPDAKIKTFDDLKGKRISIGNFGSGMRATMQEVMRRKGWSQDNMTKVVDLKAQDQSAALCKGKIDAMVFAAGHPNGAIQEVTTNCGAKLIGIEGPEIDALVKDSPYYGKVVIPAGMYPGNNEDVTTFGTMATFVTTEAMDEQTVYDTVKAVFDNLNEFKNLHPVLSLLNPEGMVKYGNTAPLHPGAARYFKEIGALK